MNEELSGVRRTKVAGVDLPWKTTEIWGSHKVDILSKKLTAATILPRYLNMRDNRHGLPK